MKSCGELMTQKILIEKVIRTSTPHFNHAIVSILELDTLVTMKMEYLIGSLQLVQALQYQTFMKTIKSKRSSRNMQDQANKRKILMVNLNPSRKEDGDQT